VFGSVVTQTRVLENDEKETKDVRLDDGYWGHADTAADFLLLPGYAMDSDGKLSKTDGTSLADILKLPEVWPPAE
jgi:hypothetical protein